MEPNSEAPQLGWGSARGAPLCLETPYCSGIPPHPELECLLTLDNIAYLVVIPS